MKPQDTRLKVKVNKLIQDLQVSVDHLQKQEEEFVVDKCYELAHNVWLRKEMELNFIKRLEEVITLYDNDERRRSSEISNITN